MVRQINWLDFMGRHDRRRKRIEVRQGLADKEAVGALIHEMAHARTTDHHGMPWKREMIRLREAGAPLMEPDMGISLDDWDGIRVTKQIFQRRVEDIQCAPSSLNLTLSNVIEDFIRNYGGARTVAEFKRKCPWAGAVFRDAKKEFAEYLKLQAELKAKLARGG